MSVWVHSLSLIVPKQVLEEKCAGGSDAVLIALSSLSRPPRTYSEADERLVCATFRDERHLARARALLLAQGLTDITDGDFVDFACVEPDHGPTAPCAWLSWRIDEEGRTIAWHAGGEEGSLWVPVEANAFEEPDSRQQLRLAREHGVETWLDFRTGAVTSHAAGGSGSDDGEGGDADGVTSCDAGSGDESADEGTDAGDDFDAGFLSCPPEYVNEFESVRRRELQLIVADTLRENGQLYHRLTTSAFAMRVRQARATYDVIVTANEETRLVSCYVTHSLSIPEARRKALAEAIVRANWWLGMGGFDLDFTEGTLRFRTAIDVEGGALVPTMVNNMIGTSLHTMERFHEAFMRVSWGGMEAGEAVAEVMGGEVG